MCHLEVILREELSHRQNIFGVKLRKVRRVSPFKISHIFLLFDICFILPDDYFFFFVVFLIASLAVMSLGRAVNGLRLSFKVGLVSSLQKCCCILGMTFSVRI